MFCTGSTEKEGMLCNKSQAGPGGIVKQKKEENHSSEVLTRFVKPPKLTSSHNFSLTHLHELDAGVEGVVESEEEQKRLLHRQEPRELQKKEGD